MSYARDVPQIRPWQRLALRWRLALALFVLLALLLAALGTLISATQEQALLSSQATALRAEAVVATRAIGGRGLHIAGDPAPPNTAPPFGGPGGAAGDLASQAQALVRRLAGPSLRATVIGSDGTILGSSDVLALDVPPAVQPGTAALEAALNAPVSNQSYILVAVNGQRQLVLLLPLVTPSGPVAVLVLNTPTAPLDASVATVRLILVLGIGVALALAALLVVPLVSVALRPLAVMEATSRRIAAGALDQRLAEPPTRDEIGRLARAFNHMVAQLEATIQRQKQFSADASHELRTPLTGISGGLEVLLLGADAGDPDAQRRLLRGMYAETARMQRLIDDLLTLARIDDGRLVMRPAPLPLAAFLREICEEAEHLAKGQTMVCDIAAVSDLTITSDADRLKQVLLNIISNAVKFTPPGGTITLSAQVLAPKEVALSVRDTGAGIPAEALPHVFDRFYRADAARARQGQGREGSGLGLAIVQALVTALGGSVTIQSAAGAGTTVSVRLPLTTAAGTGGA